MKMDNDSHSKGEHKLTKHFKALIWCDFKKPSPSKVSLLDELI